MSWQAKNGEARIVRLRGNSELFPLRLAQFFDQIPHCLANECFSFNIERPGIPILFRHLERGNQNFIEYSLRSILLPILMKEFASFFLIQRQKTLVDAIVWLQRLLIPEQD